jgi:hypothetical protein
MFAMVELRRCETFLVERSGIGAWQRKSADAWWVSAPISFTTRDPRISKVQPQRTAAHEILASIHSV